MVIRMKTVKEVSKLSGVSIRTLHYYDSIGLLRPATTTESGYRLYDDQNLERLQYILLFRELQFPLKEIGRILDSPDFDRSRALEQQITLLQLKKEHLENLIGFARGIKMIGVKKMDFSAFDTKKIDEYAEQARALYGKTEAYREFEEKSKGRTTEEEHLLSESLMELFKEFGTLRGQPPEAKPAQEMVEKLRGFISAHFYQCTPEILGFLGETYAGGGTMTENIDRAGGPGTGAFVAKAISAYCGSLANPQPE